MTGTTTWFDAAALFFLMMVSFLCFASAVAALAAMASAIYSIWEEFR